MITMTILQTFSAVRRSVSENNGIVKPKDPVGKYCNPTEVVSAVVPRVSQDPGCASISSVPKRRYGPLRK